MFWAARTEPRKDAGSPDIGEYRGDRGQAARRTPCSGRGKTCYPSRSPVEATVHSRSPTTIRQHTTNGRPDARGRGINHLGVERDALGEGDQDRGLELRGVGAGVRPPAREDVEGHLAAGDVVVVDVRDLELAPG